MVLTERGRALAPLLWVRTFEIKRFLATKKGKGWYVQEHTGAGHSSSVWGAPRDSQAGRHGWPAGRSQQLTAPTLHTTWAGLFEKEILLPLPGDPSRVFLGGMCGIVL